MTPNLVQALEYVENNSASFLDDLKTVVRLPSISTAPEHRTDMRATAEALAQLFTRSGLENPRILPTAGNPVVYADWLHAGENAITFLVYGHYDVQPVDPLTLWESGPFEPTQHGDYLFGRGASDMKGQVIAVLSAVRSWLQTGGLPVNIKFMIEGEEEIGSPHLKQFIQENKELLKSDFTLNPDAGMVAPDLPTIVYSLRGLAFFELTIHGPDHDLHSGLFGGIVHNPAVALCEIIAQMHDKEGHITLPGYYDKVRAIHPDEHRQLSRLAMGEEFYIQQTGAPSLWGESGYLPVERVGARPTLEVNGMISGYTGTGTKTVLPSNAMAKISCRLVADQNPEDVHAQMREFLAKTVPPSVRYELKYLGGSPACATDPYNPYAQSLAAALKLVWGVDPVYRREGGSIPVVADMQQDLGIDSVLTGFGLPDDCIHSPNERLHLPTWFKGIRALVHFINYLH